MFAKNSLTSVDEMVSRLSMHNKVLNSVMYSETSINADSKVSVAPRRDFYLYLEIDLNWN